MFSIHRDQKSKTSDMARKISEMAITYFLSTVDIKPKKLSTYIPAFINGGYYEALSTQEEKDFYKESYERLEFLGDAILSSTIAEYLYKNHEYAKEGMSSTLRSEISKNTVLAKIGLGLGLDAIVHKYDGSILSKDGKMYADVLEALIGAIYLDKGKKGANVFIMKYIVEPMLEHAMNTYKEQRRIIEEKRRGKQNKSEKKVNKNKNKQKQVQILPPAVISHAPSEVLPIETTDPMDILRDIDSNT